jgi:hypothetical protein
MAVDVAGRTARVPVAVEIGSKRAFARAIDWPGWCRTGRTEADALAALAGYASRYAAAVDEDDPPKDVDVDSLEVVERLDGDATTDFGAPGIEAAADRRPIDARGLDRLERALRACWRALDAAADRAQGVELRKGPRGGGRDLEKILEHVREAERAYLSKLGSKPPARGDDAAFREAVVDALRARARGEDPANANATRNRWSPRYFVHRAAWHVLDHAWEIEDRAE